MLGKLLHLSDILFHFYTLFFICLQILSLERYGQGKKNKSLFSSKSIIIACSLCFPSLLGSIYHQFFPMGTCQVICDRKFLFYQLVFIYKEEMPTLLHIICCNLLKFLSKLSGEKQYIWTNTSIEIFELFGIHEIFDFKIWLYQIIPHYLMLLSLSILFCRECSEQPTLYHYHQPHLLQHCHDQVCHFTFLYSSLWPHVPRERRWSLAFKYCIRSKLLMNNHWIDYFMYTNSLIYKFNPNRTVLPKPSIRNGKPLIMTSLQCTFFWPRREKLVWRMFKFLFISGIYDLWIYSTNLCC